MEISGLQWSLVSQAFPQNLRVHVPKRRFYSTSDKYSISLIKGDNQVSHTHIHTHAGHL